MSGGHFDYNCFRISQFAEELQMEIDKNDDLSEDDWGSTRGMGFGSPTINMLVAAQRFIELAGKLAYEIEWLYSGDIGEETFRKRSDKIFDQCGNEKWTSID